MAILFALFVILLTRSFVARARGPRSLPPSSKRSYVVAACAVFVALLPAVLDAPLVMGASAKLSGDTGSHIAIAEDIVRTKLVHGWIPTYNGGFPFALHYPAVGWLVLAGLLEMGAPPITAIKGLGFLATIAVPLLCFELFRRRGLRATSAAAGAIAITWIVPYIQFTGGWEAFLVIGLISQALVMPFVVLWGLALTKKPTLKTRFDLAPIFAALCAATHPQVFTAAAIVMGAAAIAFVDRHILFRVLRSIFVGGLMAVALYGPGVSALRVPFGWPPNLSWRVIGFGPDRLLPWLRDGEFLDYRQNPVVTYLWLAALFIHVLEVRRGVSRAILVATITTLGICMAGPSMGDLLLSVAQPMRALALVPLLVAVTIAAALDALARWLAALRMRLRGVVLHPNLLLPVAGFLLAIVEIPPRASTLHSLLVAEHRYPTHDACLPYLPGVDSSVIHRWLSTAPNVGRTAFDSLGLNGCAATEGAELGRSATMSMTYAAGAHVGMHAVAFSKLARNDVATEARAESLGVRTLVHRRGSSPTPSAAWEHLESVGNISLSRRIGGHDIVGVGCVVERLTGSEKSLFKELHERFERKTGDIPLDHPEDLIALVHGAGGGDSPVVREHVAPDGCDTASAIVRDVPREAGAFEVEVETLTPVYVVFRATAYEGWVVRDATNGTDTELPTLRVAPGFFAARVDRGRHRLRAVVSLPRFYVFGVGGALVLTLLVAIVRVRRRQTPT